MTDPTSYQHRAILEDLLATNANPRRIARKHGVSIDQIAQIITAPETTAVIQAISRMSDTTANLAIGKARLNAINALRAISCDKENTESARKASVDLIKASPAQLAQPLSNDNTEQPPTTLDAATQDMLRDALAAFASTPPDVDDAQ